ncbi:MAG TPA: PIN domain-containing protein [Candidatus Limnocylindria bacterium]|nr:PIN domain-containing protein [Candidatus Limnocylindria bacterium]
MAIFRLGGALIGSIFGFWLGAALLEVSSIDPVSNRVIVVFLLAAMCGILGWLGAPYATIVPALWVVRRIRAASAGDLLGGAFGALVGLILALLLALPLSLLGNEVGRLAPIFVAALLGMAGAVAGMLKRAEVVQFVRELRSGRRERMPGQRVLLDTSVIIDGRVADIVKCGFLRGTLVVPRFILSELQHFADAGDQSRRERGRRGLEMLARLQKEAGVVVELSDADPHDATGADAKLIALARSLGAPIVTNDYGLNRVAELQGVAVLNVNDLAKAVRPVVLPGEEIGVRLIQEGKEAGQAVGYLEDGTMIVVENGARLIGTEAQVTVMRVLQTVGGRMIFAQPRGEETARPRPARAGA